MSKPRDGFKKIRRAEKTREERALKNLNLFDLIDDSFDDEDNDSEDSYYDEDDNF